MKSSNQNREAPKEMLYRNQFELREPLSFLPNKYLISMLL